MTRTLGIALAASAVLNLFLIGGAVGLVLGHHGPGGPLREQASRLDPADRAAFVTMMQDQMQANGALLVDARQARREARRLMLAQPFDAAATSAALARARADDLQLRGHLEDAVVAFAAKLTPAERIKLSDGIAKTIGHRRPLLDWHR